MKTSLVIAIYKWPESLELVLLSILKQSVLPNEVLIADDDSTIETKQLIKRYSSKLKSGIKHIWQKDEGFQKTSILNKSIAKDNGYNEDLNGWEKEDTKLSVRLMNSGLQKLKLKCLAVCYHLNHKISSKEGLNINNSILTLVIKEKREIYINGINKYAN
jgi:glycosyltransferase involved in cell wall biosynthesis